MSRIPGVMLLALLAMRATLKASSPSWECPAAVDLSLYLLSRKLVSAALSTVPWSKPASHRHRILRASITHGVQPTPRFDRSTALPSPQACPFITTLRRFARSNTAPYLAPALEGALGVPIPKAGAMRQKARVTRAFPPLAFMILLSCGDGEITEPRVDPVVLRLPVVVHVVHLGEPIGIGHNLSRERIESQIRVLNEDYRRKPGTRGFNTHPDGGDARIEFVLASVAPDGMPTDGVVRIDAAATPNPLPPGSSLFDYYAFYSYWNPSRYINVWTMPLPEDLIDTVLGQATGPLTDLPGADLLLRGEPEQAEGILINSHHFGVSDLPSEHNLGRTLTHEMGHYLGLLHTWGGGDCEANDYCADTPPVSAPVRGCPATPPPACDGRPIMIENYMNWTTDECMNTFTNDQIARMHYVLETSPWRRELPESPGLGL